MISIQQLIHGNRLQLHLYFCLAAFVILTTGMWLLYFSGFHFSSIISAFTDCFFFLLCVYTGRWLCANWYLSGRLSQFLVFSIIAVIFLSALKFTLVKYIFSHPYAGFMEVVRDVMPFFLVGMVMGVLLKLVSASMQKESRDAAALAAQRASEFNLLQAQLSPHFLFNVLNNLYGISIEEQQRVPALLLKLSSLLRYSVYGSRKTFVPLKEELEYIHNYIEFEQIRMSDRLILETSLAQVISTNIKIAPMVLIVFIENAFKHAKNTLDQKVYIYISLGIAGEWIHFSVRNVYRQEENKSVAMDGDSGLGLANTVRRLDLLYGKDYMLKQDPGGTFYTVELNLKIIHG